MRIQIRSTLLAAAACAALAHQAAAQPMNIVTVGAPAINCLFSTSCSVVVSDHTAPVLGGGFLQSRTFQAQPGSPMAGKWVYQYRLDLTNAVSPSGTPAATSLSIQVPSIPAANYNGDRVATDNIFVITSGGLGTVGPSSAHLWGDTLHVAFAPPVPGGTTSYFFGFTSDTPPQETVGRLEINVAPETFLSVRTPAWPGAAAAGAAPRPGRPILRPTPVRPETQRPIQRP
jgi:hypothetical protein